MRYFECFTRDRYSHDETILRGGSEIGLLLREHHLLLLVLRFGFTDFSPKQPAGLLGISSGSLIGSGRRWRSTIKPSFSR